MFIQMDGQARHQMVFVIRFIYLNDLIDFWNAEYPRKKDVW